VSSYDVLNVDNDNEWRYEFESDICSTCWSCPVLLSFIYSFYS